MITNGAEEKNIYVSTDSHHYIHYEGKEKTFSVKILEIELFILPSFPFLLEMGTCNEPALGFSVIQNFAMIFTSCLKVSSYPMPLSTAMDVASQLRNSYILFSGHTTSFYVKA